MSAHLLTRDLAIQRLQAIEAEIRRLGVRRLALFGSVLRNEARPDSDVNVLFEFSPDQKSFDRFMTLADLLEEALGCRVEIVTTEALDKGKAKTPRADTILFIDARHIYRQVDRAHRDWTPAQIGFIANLARLYRGEAPDLTVGGNETAAKLAEVFGQKPAYADVPGLCKAATLAEIEAQGWSLNPGRYVGVAPGEEVSDEDFKEQLEALNEELEVLNAQARELEQTIAANVVGILGA